MLLAKGYVESKFRDETTKSLSEARQALLIYAKVNGKLPFADNFGGDGLPNTDLLGGYIPYLTLGVTPRDPQGNNIKYLVSTSMGSCSWVKDRVISPNRYPVGGTFSTQSFVVSVWDGDPVNYRMAVAAILISPGGNKRFDSVKLPITGYIHNNNNMPPTDDYYIRYKFDPAIPFDDVVTYISFADLYASMCSDGKPSTP